MKNGAHIERSSGDTGMRAWVLATLLVSALALAGVAVAGASDLAPGELAEFDARAAEAGWTEADRLGALARLDALLAAELPARPVLSRYLEGMAKGIPASRIDAATADLAQRLQLGAATVASMHPQRFEAMSPADRNRLIDHAAYALGTGMTPDQLAGSLHNVAAEPEPLSELDAPILALGMLNGSGLDAGLSQDLVASAWSQGYRGAELERLGLAVVSLGSEGTAPPMEIVREVIDQIDRDVAPAQVFQSLDDLVGRGLDGYRLPEGDPGDLGPGRLLEDRNPRSQPPERDRDKPRKGVDN